LSNFHIANKSLILNVKDTDHVEAVRASLASCSQCFHNSSLKAASLFALAFKSGHIGPLSSTLFGRVILALVFNFASSNAYTIVLKTVEAGIYLPLK